MKACLFFNMNKYLELYLLGFTLGFALATFIAILIFNHA